MPELSEKQIENAILNYLAYVDGFFWKNNSVGIYDAKKGLYRKSRNKFAINGVSDIIGVYKGRAVFIEVKAKRGRLSPSQVKFLDEVKKQGAIAGVAKSVDDVIELLELKAD